MKIKRFTYFFFSFLLFLVVSSVYLFFSSCGMKGLSAVLGPGGTISGQPPVFAVSSFKLTGSNPQPLELSLGYYNNIFDPFKFVNLSIQSGFSFVPFSYSNDFRNQLTNKKVIIFGTGWRYSNPLSTDKDIFWVGKIINSNLGVSDVATFTDGGNNYKTIKGRNFVARFTTGIGGFNSNLETSGALTFNKATSGEYDITDFDNINEDFRAVAFKSDGSSAAFAGSIVGRNTAFYSSLPMANWQNALSNTVFNKPPTFIAFDVIQSGATPNSFIFIGSDIAESKAELRVFFASTNSWSNNYIDSFSSVVGTNVYPLYSSDYVSNNINQDIIRAAVIVGKGLMLYWGDNDSDGIFDLTDSFVIYLNPSITFYGGNIIKDANSNRVVLVGYDDTNQRAVIYRGIAQDSNGDVFIDSDPQEVDLSGLGLNLQNTIFLDVNSVGENVVVVGVDLTNCNIKPYPQVGIPKLTKSLIFPGTTNDNDIINTFNNMRGVILYSNNAGQTFTLFTNLIK
ncbi:MAG: hypothetical protein RMJ36_03295 [Candidatus Calescibacterium sp.]|nr:hypothetical protein [Candidatus Calescibacterium sp.]MDW8132661.1 hypothetical protein [Candidatus Calescibacterium sp.]